MMAAKSSFYNRKQHIPETPPEEVLVSPRLPRQNEEHWELYLALHAVRAEVQSAF